MDFSGILQSASKFDRNKNQAGAIFNLEMNNIRPNPNQPRKDFDDGELLLLAEDMKRNGLIQPIVVRPDTENPGKYIIVTGERRYRAAQLNGDERIKAVVNEDWKDEQIGYVQMSENLQRSDLKFWELADFIIAHADAGEKQSEIAKKLGLTKSRVSLYMKWKEVPDYIRENRNKIRAIAAAVDLAKMPEDEVRKLFEETPEGEFVSASQASKALKPDESPAAPVSDAVPESSGEAASTEAESSTSEQDSGSSETPEGAAESFAESSDTGTADSGSSDGDSFFNEGSSESSESGSGETEFTGDSGSSGSSENFSEPSGSESESFTSEQDSGSSEAPEGAAESFAESSDTGTADSGSSSDDSFFSEGSSDSSESSDAASGETDSGSDSSSLAFDLDKPDDDEFKKPIIVGSVDGREAELLWKKKPQTDGWVVVKYEDGTTEEVLAERYKLNRIYEIN